MERWEKLRCRMIKSLAQIHSKLITANITNAGFIVVGPTKSPHIMILSPPGQLPNLSTIFLCLLAHWFWSHWGCASTREMTVAVANTGIPAFSHTTLLGLAPFILLAISWEGSCFYHHFQMRHSTQPRSPSQKVAELGFIPSKITNSISSCERLREDTHTRQWLTFSEDGFLGGNSLFCIWHSLLSTCSLWWTKDAVS